jgi:hypothetical protein
VVLQACLPQGFHRVQLGPYYSHTTCSLVGWSDDLACRPWFHKLLGSDGTPVQTVYK